MAQLALGIAAFGAGLWLLVASVEGLVRTLQAWALAAGVSGVVLGALVLGLDIESTAAGVAANLRELHGSALGATVGAAIFLMTAGLGIAALVAPFHVRPPAVLLGAGAIATAMAILVAADGTVSRLDGAVLVGVFVPLVAAVAMRAPRPPAAEERRPRPDRLLGRVVLGLVGVVVGAEALVFGTGRIVDELELSETVFGLLVVAAAVSFEEVVLQALPAFRGFPELSVGNALGTLVFLLTGSLGVIALVAPLPVIHSVRSYHLPALAGAVALSGAMLARGRMGRADGIVLLGGYAAYVVVAVAR